MLIDQRGHDLAATILPITSKGVRKQQETLPKMVQGVSFSGTIIGTTQLAACEAIELTCAEDRVPAF